MGGVDPMLEKTLIDLWWDECVGGEAVGSRFLFRLLRDGTAVFKKDGLTVVQQEMT
jgi:hypothetical protein